VRGRTILSTAARKWSDAAGVMLMAQRAKAVKGPVEIHISLSPLSRRKFDISNRIKILEDCLVRYGLIEADDATIVRRLTVEVGEGLDGDVTVTITPIAEKP
jgi:Holliday junction resolvase RusA-like endonuclease